MKGRHFFFRFLRLNEDRLENRQKGIYNFTKDLHIFDSAFIWIRYSKVVNPFLNDPLFPGLAQFPLSQSSFFVQTSF